MSREQIKLVLANGTILFLAMALLLNIVTARGATQRANQNADSAIKAAQEWKLVAERWEQISNGNHQVARKCIEAQHGMSELDEPK